MCGAAARSALVAHSILLGRRVAESLEEGVEIVRFNCRFGVLAILCFSAMAQDSATLTVAVVDPSFATVPEAGVALTDLRRASVTRAQTDESGYATFNFLEPSEYSLTATRRAGPPRAMLRHNPTSSGPRGRTRFRVTSPRAHLWTSSTFRISLLTGETRNR